jgi:hypothetical protein
MNISIIWDITKCTQLKVSRRFAETYLHLQGLSRRRPELFLPPSFTLVSCLIVDPEDGGDLFL